MKVELQFVFAGGQESTGEIRHKHSIDRVGRQSWSGLSSWQPLLNELDFENLDTRVLKWLLYKQCRYNAIQKMNCQLHSCNLCTVNSNTQNLTHKQVRWQRGASQWSCTALRLYLIYLIQCPTCPLRTSWSSLLGMAEV